MVSHTTWIVFAHLVLFNPQGNGNENELKQWPEKKFTSQNACYQFLSDNYDKLDAELQRHAKTRNGRVIILACGDTKRLSKTSLQYELYHKRGQES